MISCFWVFNFFISLFSRKSKPKHRFVGKNEYTHWDIYPLARALAPESWAVYDAVVGTRSYLDNYKGTLPNGQPSKLGTHDSFSLAARVFSSGYKVPHEHLWNDEDVANYLKENPPTDERIYYTPPRRAA